MNLTHFQPQLESIIAEKLAQGYTLSELAEPLLNHKWWWNDDLYRLMPLHYENAHMSLLAWCNAFELATGSPTYFEDNIRMMLDGIIWDKLINVEQIEQVEEYKHELEVAV